VVTEDDIRVVHNWFIAVYNAEPRDQSEQIINSIPTERRLEAIDEYIKRYNLDKPLS